MFGKSTLDVFAPMFNLTINNSPIIEEVKGCIKDISVTQVFDAAANFNILVATTDPGLIDANTGIFKEGSLVSISMGYQSEKMEKMMLGEISSVGINFGNDGGLNLNITGYDLLHNMARGNYNRKFDKEGEDSGYSASDIVKEIAGESGLSAVTDSSPILTVPITQDFESNQSILNKLAVMTGFHFWVEEKKLFFKEKYPKKNVIKLKWGDSLLDFSTTINTDQLIDSVSVKVRKQTDKSDETMSLEKKIPYGNKISSEAKKIIAKSIEDISKKNKLASNTEEAEKMLMARIKELIRELFKGSGSTMGNQNIQVGTVLDIKNIGRFSNKYLVNSVTHSIGEGGYTTSFEVMMEDGF